MSGNALRKNCIRNAKIYECIHTKKNMEKSENLLSFIKQPIHSKLNAVSMGHKIAVSLHRKPQP